MGLIAGEVDVNLPDITFQELEDFLTATKFRHEHSKAFAEEQTYFERNGRRYPWDRRVLEFNGIPNYNFKDITPFNRLVEIIDSLPIVKSSRIILLISQKEQADYDFNFHFDLDAGYGFRLCFGLDVSKTFLEMSKLKPEYLAHGRELKKIEQTMVEDKVYEIIPSKSNTVFCINGNEYPHRVPVNNSEARFVLIVRGDLMSLDDVKFLKRIEE
jgi:hypothetical protein